MYRPIASTDFCVAKVQRSIVRCHCGWHFVRLRIDEKAQTWMVVAAYWACRHGKPTEGVSVAWWLGVRLTTHRRKKQHFMKCYTRSLTRMEWQKSGENFVTVSFMIYILRQVLGLLEWSNEGGWCGRGILRKLRRSAHAVSVWRSERKRLLGRPPFDGSIIVGCGLWGRGLDWIDLADLKTLLDLRVPKKTMIVLSSWASQERLCSKMADCFSCH
jgi:hypothetical protein